MQLSDFNKPCEKNSLLCIKILMPAAVVVGFQTLRQNNKNKKKSNPSMSFCFVYLMTKCGFSGEEKKNM